jgi:hypothetical protein
MICRLSEHHTELRTYKTTLPCQNALYQALRVENIQQGKNDGNIIEIGTLFVPRSLSGTCVLSGPIPLCLQVCTMGDRLAFEAEGQGYQTPATKSYGFGLVLLGLFKGKRPLSTLRTIKVSKTEAHSKCGHLAHAQKKIHILELV